MRTLKIAMGDFLMNRFRLSSTISALSFCVFVAGCSNGKSVTSSNKSLAITLNPCGTAGTLSLSVATSTKVDCSAGGTTLTLAGNGASYLIVPEFPTDQVPLSNVPYQLYTGNVAAASASISRLAALRSAYAGTNAAGSGTLPLGRRLFAQRAAEKVLRARAAQRAAAPPLSASLRRPLSAAVLPTPAVGSIRSFHVANSFTVNSWATVAAKLAYAGASVLIYIDTLAPANGFTPAQLSAFGLLFDQTLYPIDTAAFGGPSDTDNNGHVIMLMTPVVNADTPASTCQTQGFVAGFFDSGDFQSLPANPNSNQGEIFYSIVPDTAGKFSCAHGVGEVGFDVPGTFMHEMQHLINYSQHVVVSGGSPSDSWLDEGMSIVAEELGSLYYEQKCPGTACRTNPAQIFPDSSQGFVSDFLYDSYQYAYLPDTASITLSTDDQNGFSWRGGAWLFARWLGDQMGSSVYRQLERGPSNAITDVQQVTGQAFPAIFANFGLSLYTDSLPGLPRNTAPAVNRFVSRNVRQLWARLFATSGGAGSGIPTPSPVLLFPITSDTTTSTLVPGSMTFFRLDTPATAATVTIQFAAPGGIPFAPGLRAQMAVFRLPPGQ
ncbi:MAG TPA: hypothetical protein VF368_08740 [Gemmatimonadaceae bacterium]